MSSFSPVKASPSLDRYQGNLTGIPRRIKDTVADIYNATIKWDKLRIGGATLIKEISEELMISGTSLPSARAQKLALELRSVIWESLREHCDSLREYARQLAAVGELEEQQSSIMSVDGATEQRHFLSWPTGRFGEAALEIADAYGRELSCKLRIIETLGDLSKSMICDTEEMSYRALNAAWTYESCIHPDVKRTLLALLFEVGFNQ